MGGNVDVGGEGHCVGVESEGCCLCRGGGGGGEESWMG